jgi:prepilin signal peptidase PulO-like enzyme (type II secretory pathway)
MIELIFRELNSMPVVILVLLALTGFLKILYGHTHIFLYDIGSMIVQTLAGTGLAILSFVIIRNGFKRAIHPVDPVMLACFVPFVGLSVILFTLVTGFILNALVMIACSVLRLDNVEKRIPMTSYLAYAMLLALFVGGDFVKMFVDTFI